MIYLKKNPNKKMKDSCTEIKKIKYFTHER